MVTDNDYGSTGEDLSVSKEVEIIVTTQEED
jgi:hypothetical protein